MYSDREFTRKTVVRAMAWLFAVLPGVPSGVLSQERSAVENVSVMQMPKLQAQPAIDGVVGEAEWAGAEVFDGHFVQNAPEIGVQSPFRTIVRIAQTESSLLVAIEAFDPDMARLSAAYTQRDRELELDDSVAVMFDTFNDGRTAYLFRTNAISTQQDGRIADNGRVVDLRWDASWRSAAIRLEDRWTVEFEIPFSILQFSTAGDWGMNLVRTVPRRLESSLWSGPAEDLYRVTRFGRLHGVATPELQDPWVWIPYVLASYEDGRGGDVEAGIDVRWRPTGQLGVDLTVNPDFALIEADVETINLSRFELLIPEKRPFFLEGNEMYAQRIRQFYSRRIGDITWGAKSNGKIANTGFSAIVTSEELLPAGEVEEETANYGIVRLQRSLPKGSNIGLLAASRNFQDQSAGSAGLDATLFFSDTVGMTAQYLQVHGPTSDNGSAWFVRPAWDTANSHFHVRYTNLDDGIQDDFNAVGFLRDDNRREFDTNLRHTFWFDGTLFEKFEPGVNYNRFYSQDDVLRSWELDASASLVFRNGFEIEFEYVDDFQLFEKAFRNNSSTVSLGWDGRDGRYFSVWAGGGVNFDDDLSMYGAEIQWPIGDQWRFSYEYTSLDLSPDFEQRSTDIHVFEMLYSFHANLFAKVFIQTNSAIEKENIQALWVWRFKPPFGSLQFAYQTGTSVQGQVSDQGDTLFTKLAWVF